MVGTGIRVSTSFVSCGVNRVVNALDWGDNGLIAYCGHRIVCIYDSEVSGVSLLLHPSYCCCNRQSLRIILCCIWFEVHEYVFMLLFVAFDYVLFLQTAEVVGTLTGHCGQVNCVKWLPSSGTVQQRPVLDTDLKLWFVSRT